MTLVTGYIHHTYMSTTQLIRKISTGVFAYLRIPLLESLLSQPTNRLQPGREGCNHSVMRSHASLYGVFLIACLNILFAKSVQGDTILANDLIGNWFAPSTWYDVTTGTSKVPDSADLVYIDSEAEVNISGGSASASQFTFDFAGILNLSAGSLNIGNDIDLSSDSYLNISNTGALDVSGSEYIGIADGSSGFYNVTQTGGSNTAGGDVIIEGTASYQGTGSYNLEGGTLNIDSGSLTVNTSGTFSMSGGTTTLSAQSENISGSFVQSSGTHTVSNTITVTGNNAVYNVQSGNLTAGAVSVGNGGSFTNSGFFSVTGATGQALQTSGQFTQNSSGVFNEIINGSNSGQYGQVVAGSAHLAGSLDVTLGNSNGTDFQPAGSDVYGIIGTSTGVVGTFGNVRKLVGAESTLTDKVVGVFNVNYNQGSGSYPSGVTLSNYRQTAPLDFFGIGVNWTNAPPEIINGVPEATDGVRGDLGAYGLETCLAQNLPNLNIGMVVDSPGSPGLGLTATSGYAVNDAAINTAYATFKGEIGASASDTVVFYLASHGSQDGIALSSNTTDSLFGATELKADLEQLPATTKKIVIVDACESGAFLSQLTGMADTALLAATTGTGLAFTGTDGSGIFTADLETELNNGVYDLQQIESDIGQGMYDAGNLGQTLALEDAGTGTFEGEHPQLNESGDFTGDFVGPAPVPEPSTWGMLAVAGALLFLMRLHTRRRPEWRVSSTRRARI